jgi:hypothetical protein
MYMTDELVIPQTWSVNDVRRWLLQLFGKQGYSELPGLSSQIDGPVAIQGLFDHAGTSTQELLKAAAVSALREWRLRAHGYQALDQLARTTALLRATAAVPVLADIAGNLVQRPAVMRDVLQEEQRIETLSQVIACLCGFAPGDDVEAALRRLFYDSHVEPSIAGQLFVGLCYCKPEAYPSYVPRFLALRKRVRGGFPYIGSAFLDAVPPVTVIDKFEELDAPSREAVVEMISTTSNREFDYRWSNRGVELFWVGLPGKAVLPAPAAVKDKIDFMATHYSSAMHSYEGKDVTNALIEMTGSVN